MRFVQRIESVEKFLLNPLFTGKELDVVDQQYLGLPVFLPKTDQLIVLNPINVFIGEFLGRKVSNTRSFAMADDVLANGMEQMGFAQPDSTVQEQRIVRFARRLRDCLGRGISKVVIISNDKSVKRILGIKIEIVISRVPVGRSLSRLCFCCCGQSDGSSRQPRQGSYFESDLQLLPGGNGKNILQ